MRLKHTVFYQGILILLMISYSCDTKDNDTPILTQEEKNSKSLSEEEIVSIAKRHIESHLQINATENYSMTHHAAYLDNDTLTDYVFLVNRSEYALKKVEAENKQDMFEYLGRTGPHNHVFVYLNNEGKFLNSVPIGSAVEYPLTVDFGFLTSPTRKDFWVSYRTRNSIHRNYYTIKNNQLYLTFNCPVFDRIGDSTPKAFAINHKEVDERIAKDIYIYEGIISNYNPNEIENVNNYTPDSIIPTEDLYVYFFFDDKEMVYKTPFKPSEVNN